MARRKGKVPPHLRRYLFKRKKKKHRRKARSMAKRRKRRSHTRRRAPVRRRTHTRRRRGGRRGGGGYALMPGRDDVKLWGASAAIGFVETKAKADDSFFLNKLPKPVDAIGYTGNLALALWVASHFFKNQWLRLGARAAAGITAYQLGRMGKAFATGKDFFVVSGWTDDDVAQAIEQNMGALRAAGSDDMPGVPGIEAFAQYGEYGDG